MSLEISEDPSFFKILLDLSSKLWIPNEFVKKYGDILPQEEALLVTDDESGKSWNVEIEQQDDCFCFANGWPEFVKDNQQIIALDVAVFTLVKGSTFQVTIYGKNGVKKHL